MYSKEINELIDPQILQAAERKNVYIRSNSNQYGPTDEIIFQFPSNKDKYSEYLDFRDAYVQYDIVGVGQIATIDEARRITMLASPGIVATLATAGSFRVQVGDYITQLIAFNINFLTVASHIQAILDTNYTGIIITALNPLNTFETLTFFDFTLSGFDDSDWGSPENVVQIIIPSDFNTLNNAGTRLIASSTIPTQGTLSTPRLCRNGPVIFNRIYAEIGSSLFNINSANILENILLTGCDPTILRSYAFSRSGTNWGLNIQTVRRLVFPLRSLPIFNSLIMPGFIKDPLQIRFTLESAIRCLSMANVNQSFLVTNVEINYHTLKFGQSMCDMIYSRALGGDLAIRFETWQNDNESFNIGDVSVDQILNYSYQNVTGLLSVLTANEDTGTGAGFIGATDKLNKFYKEGVQGYRLEASNGKFYPIDQIQILGNTLYSQGESENEFVRTIGLKLGMLDSGRQSCLGFVSYGENTSFYDFQTNEWVSPSFVMAIDLSSEKSDNAICKNGISMKGSTDNRFKIILMNSTKQGHINTFIKYCGVIAIRPDLSVLILN